MTGETSTITTDENSYMIGEMFFFICGALVFLMQAGFAMLEVGSVSKASALNIIFKNMMDACIGGLSWWLIGYGLAFGSGTTNFAAQDKFALTGESFQNISANFADGKTGEYSMWFFQFTFAATATTIVSGAVAERTALSAYLIYSFLISGIVYPVVVFWGWGSGFDNSWSLAFPNRGSMHDFAGSGIVHMVGGTAGLVGSIIIGPRRGRFTETDTNRYAPHNQVVAALGTLILWFGWYGFNCGSGSVAISGKVATITTIGAVSCAFFGTVLGKLIYKVWSVTIGLNCVLAGLVSITAAANVLEPWGAFMAGLMGAPIYLGSSELLRKLKVDDPLDAFPIHGVCGFWGLLVVGIFGTSDAFLYATGDSAGCRSTGGCGDVLLANLCFGLSVLMWTALCSLVIFGSMKLVGLSKCTPEDMKTYPTYQPSKGIDFEEHGASAYILEMTPYVEEPIKTEMIKPEKSVQNKLADGDSDKKLEEAD